MKKENTSIGHLLFNIIPVIAIIAMIVFGALYLRDYIQYKKADDEYTQLADLFIQNIDSDNLENGKKGLSKESSENDTADAYDPYDPYFFPILQIDYDALSKTNADFAAVIYIPALNLRYPIVYSTDNVDYLHKTFEGKQNSAGAIFYDSLSPRDFTGMNTFIFGHNMKNGSMFGTLKNFERDDSLCSADPFIYIYAEDFVRKYRIFSYYETTMGSTTYEDFDGDDGYDQYVKSALKKSYFSDEENNAYLANRPKLLTLSTCTGQSGSGRRYVIHALLYAETNALLQ